MPIEPQRREAPWEVATIPAPADCGQRQGARRRIERRSNALAGAGPDGRGSRTCRSCRSVSLAAGTSRQAVFAVIIPSTFRLAMPHAKIFPQRRRFRKLGSDELAKLFIVG